MCTGVQCTHRQSVSQAGSIAIAADVTIHAAPSSPAHNAPTAAQFEQLVHPPMGFLEPFTVTQSTWRTMAL